MPFLTNIEIENYRGFYLRQNIAPAVPSNKRGSGLTVLVGPNNSGKTTVVNAIRSVARGPRPIDVEHRHLDKPLLLAIRNDANQEKKITNPDLGATAIMEGDPAAFPSVEHIRIAPSRRAWSPYTSTERMQVQDYWNRQMQLEEQDNFLISRIGAFDPEERKRFTGLLKELLPQLNTWRMELSRGQSFIQYETESGARHAADLFGDGMASLFRVALTLFDSASDRIIIIDEPELSLHPQAQKALASVLSRYSADRQIIITTHSPYFVNWSDLALGAKVYRLTQESDGIVVGKLRDETITALGRLIADWQKPNLLDAVAREIFFADEVVVFGGTGGCGPIEEVFRGSRAAFVGNVWIRGRWIWKH